MNYEKETMNIRQSLEARLDWYEKSINMALGKIPYDNNFVKDMPDIPKVWTDMELKPLITKWRGSVKELKNIIDMLEANNFKSETGKIKELKQTISEKENHIIELQNKLYNERENKSKKIIVDVGFADLIAEICTDEVNYTEITVCLEDKNGLAIQDIVLIRKKENAEKTVQCLVYADEYTDDYTHDFKIKMYERD